MSGKTLAVKCTGPCPCISEPVPKPETETPSVSKAGESNHTNRHIDTHTDIPEIENTFRFQSR